MDLGTDLPVPEDNNRYKTLFSCRYKIDRPDLYIKCYSQRDLFF